MDAFFDWMYLFGIKSVLITKTYLIASMSAINIFWEPKENLMEMKLQIFLIKKFQKLTLIKLV